MRRDLVLAAAAGGVTLGALASLLRVFASGDWRAPALAALLLSLAVAAGARAVRGGAVASAVASLAGLVVFTYVVHLEAGGLLPGLEQLREAGGLLGDGLRAFRDRPAPVPVLPGLLLLVTSGVWIVVHVTHELLVRWHRAALALVPAATLWIVPLAVPLAPGRTWPFALPFLAGAGLVLLLSADADVTDWTRDADATRPSGAGLAVGAAALLIATIVPAAVPGYGAAAWVDVSTAQDPRGYQPIVDVSDRLKLPEERDVLEVVSARPLYLRLAGLDSFDGSTWRLGPPDAASYRPDPESLYRTDGPLPVEVPIREQTLVTAQVTVLDLANIYVPVPYQPVRIEGPQSSEMIYSTEGGFVATWQTAENEIGGQLRVGVREGFAYGVEAALPTPDIDQLREVDVGDVDDRYTRLPVDYAELAAAAEEVYAEADAETAVDKALALQAWFAGDDAEFTYDLEVPALRGDGALRDFVFGTKTGYCEYFATAMAVMLRATGIPARVAVGFLPGSTDESGDAGDSDDSGGDGAAQGDDTPVDGVGDEVETYTVTTNDAHAWVEVLFPEYGWVTFEPTPRSDGGEIRPREQNLSPAVTEQERRERESGQTDESDESGQPDSAVRDPADRTLPEGIAGEANIDGGGQDGGNGWVVAALALLALGLGAWVVARRRRFIDPTLPPVERILAAQRRVLATAGRVGLGRRPSETAAEATRRWIAEGHTEPSAAERFATLSQRAAFGGDVSDEDGTEALALSTALSGQLRDAVDARTRLVAPVRMQVERATTATRSGVGLARRWWSRDDG